MNIAEAEKGIKQRLEDVYDENESSTLARMVLEYCTGLSRTEITLNGHQEISLTQRETIKNYIERLRLHEPIQYIANKAFFYGLELYVNEAVLIPRPETEELVDWIVKDMQATHNDVFQKATTDADATNSLKILDVGTGSGCIALALKKAIPKAEVWGCDVSEEALNVARRNGSLLDIRVDFQGINFLDEAGQKSLPTVDVIVSNPPYIPLQDKASMQPNVVRYEPHSALFVADDDPLIFYKTIARFAKKRLYQNGAIYMEVHEDFGRDVVRLFEEEGYQNIELRKDIQGKERMVKAVRREPINVKP